MENYKEYRNKLFEAFMDAECPQEEVEYEEVEVEPVFLISEDEELTEENTAVIIEDEEFSGEPLNELWKNLKGANYKGHRVTVDKNSGIIQSGEFKGKRVNLVKDRKRTLKGVYKSSDYIADMEKKGVSSARDSMAAKKVSDYKAKNYEGAVKDVESGKDLHAVVADRARKQKRYFNKIRVKNISDKRKDFKNIDKERNDKTRKIVKDLYTN